MLKIKKKIRYCRDLANKNHFVRFPNENIQTSTFPTIPRQKSFSEHHKIKEGEENVNFHPYLNVNQVKLYPNKEKFSTFNELENKIQCQKNNKSDMDIIMHYAGVLKEKCQLQAIKAKNFEIKVEKPPKERGFFEFIGVMKSQKTSKKKENPPNKLVNLVIKRAFEEIDYYGTIVTSFKKKEKFDIDQEKLDGFLLQLQPEKQVNAKLFKEDLFISNILLCIHRKGINFVDQNDITTLEKILYSRKQCLTRLINYIYLPMTANREEAPRNIRSISVKKKSEISQESLPKMKPEGLVIKRASIYSESAEKIKKKNSVFQQPPQILLPPSAYQSDRSKKMSLKSPPIHARSSAPKLAPQLQKDFDGFSEIQNSEIIDKVPETLLSEMREFDEIFDSRPKNTSKHRYSEVRKISSCQNILPAESMDLGSHPGSSNENSIINNKLPSFDDIPYVESKRNSMISIQRNSILQKRKENEEERKRFDSWSKFLKDSIQFETKKPEFFKPKYDFSNDDLYNEKVTKVEELLRDFFLNRKHDNEKEDQTRMKTSSSTKSPTRLEPKRKSHTFLRKKPTKTLLKSIFSKRMKNEKEAKERFHSFTKEESMILDFSPNFSNKKANLTLNTYISNSDHNRSNILDQDVSQVFEDYKKYEKHMPAPDIKPKMVAKPKLSPLNKAKVEPKVKQSFLRKRESQEQFSSQKSVKSPKVPPKL